jgi:hypothetical protein
MGELLGGQASPFQPSPFNAGDLTAREGTSGDLPTVEGPLTSPLLANGPARPYLGTGVVWSST